MRVIVTGGAGFIGSHLVDQLMRNTELERLLIIDDLRLGKHDNISNIAPSRSEVQIDFCEMSAKIAFTGQLGTIHAFDPDVIYNLAVDPLPKSFNKPMEVWNNNVESTWAIAHYCMNTNTRMVHFSSSEVYGTKPVGLLSETDLMLPTTPYAASKAACDNMLLSLHETYNLDVVTVRPFNTIGPRQNQGSYAGIIPLTINRINKGKAPVIYGTGKQTRDISYVTDVTSAATTVAALGASGECYNVCSGIETSIEWLINEICYHMGYEGQVEYRHKRCADVMRHQGDNTKIKTLGWQPSVAIRKSVARTVEWYKCGSK